MTAQWEQWDGPLALGTRHPNLHSQPAFHESASGFSQQTSPVNQNVYAPPAPTQGVAAAPVDGRLRSVDELPGPFRSVFPFRFFNAIQNDCWPAIYDSSTNVVVAAPTGGGKTVLLELAILRLLSRNLVPAGRGSGSAAQLYAHKPGHLKAVYLAPSRALVQEKVRDWGQRFSPLGLVCRELTGDTDHEGVEGLDGADIICATPEKFDATTRAHLRLFADIGLVLIDEVHLLNENRGASLEGVVSRIKMVSRLREMQGQAIGSVRYVAVSATIPNVQDLAEWLMVPPAGIKCFGEEMRPVKLRTVVRGYNPTKTDFLFERRLNDHIFQVIAEHSSGKPALVFCSSRNGTTDTAAALAREAGKAAGGSGSGSGRSPSAYVRNAAQLARLQAVAAGIRDGRLRECVAMGVGYHNAALEPGDRAAVEALFVAQDLPVLCTTSTLAMGVNLPARLVVLKGTRRYVGSEADDPSGYQEYERSTCLQMVGRAGRPQFDTEGVAVIMTQKAHVRRYEQLMNGSELVESTLKEVLPEFLNAEITLHTINDVSQAVEWLRCTYLYTRVKRSPGRYNVPQQATPEALDRWLRDRLVLATVGQLAEHGMVRLQDDGFGLEPLKPGQIMAERYIRMHTMVSLCGTPWGAAMPELISILARSAELSNIKLRRSEKKVLNEINHSAAARHPLMNPAKPSKVLERVATGPDKIHVLINEGLSDAPCDKLEYSMRQDVEQALSVGRRIAGAMIKYFEHAGRAAETFNALLLAKSLRQRLWTDSAHETRQLPGIGQQIAQRLAAAGVSKLAQLAAVEPRRLESLAQRHYPFGNEVHAALGRCMPPGITLECLPVAWLPSGLVELEVTVERTSESAAPSPARLLVGSLHDDALLLCRSLALEQFPSPLVLRCRTRAPVKGRGKAVEVVASVVHERLVGVDTAVRTVVPPGVELQGQRCQLAGLKQEPSCGVAESSVEQQRAQQEQQTHGAKNAGRGRQRGTTAGKTGGPNDSAEEAEAAPGMSVADATEADALPSGVSGALQLMQHRLAASGGGEPAPCLPPAPPPLLVLSQVHRADIRVPESAAAGAMAAPAPELPPCVPRPTLNLPAPPPAAAGRGKWRSFVAEAAPVPHPQPSAQRQQQQQQTVAGGQHTWQTQIKRVPRQPTAAEIARPLGVLSSAGNGQAALRPDNSLPASASQAPLGRGLFSRFALGSSSPAGPASCAAPHKRHDQEQRYSLAPRWPAPQTIAAGAHSAVGGGSAIPAAAPAQQAAFEAEPASKRRKLGKLTPRKDLVSDPPVSSQALQPALLPVRASAATAASAPATKKLLLPKLAWLTGRMGAASTTNEAPAAAPASAPAPPSSAAMVLAPAAATVTAVPGAAGHAPAGAEPQKQQHAPLDFAPVFDFFL